MNIEMQIISWERKSSGEITVWVRLMGVYRSTTAGPELQLKMVSPHRESPRAWRHESMKQSLDPAAADVLDRLCAEDAALSAALVDAGWQPPVADPEVVDACPFHAEEFDDDGRCRSCDLEE